MSATYPLPPDERTEIPMRLDAPKRMRPRAPGRWPSDWPILSRAEVANVLGVDGNCRSKRGLATPGRIHRLAARPGRPCLWLNRNGCERRDFEQNPEASGRPSMIDTIRGANSPVRRRASR